MVIKKKFALSTTQIILLSFLVTILLGSVLLALPISSATGEAVPYLDALFTATTSTCVTGLVTVEIGAAYSAFGQTVILLLIQTGGLGAAVLGIGAAMLAGRAMSLRARHMIQESWNLGGLDDLGRIFRRVRLPRRRARGGARRPATRQRRKVQNLR